MQSIDTVYFRWLSNEWYLSSRRLMKCHQSARHYSLPCLSGFLSVSLPMFWLSTWCMQLNLLIEFSDRRMATWPFSSDWVAQGRLHSQLMRTGCWSVMMSMLGRTRHPSVCCLLHLQCLIDGLRCWWWSYLVIWSCGCWEGSHCWSLGSWPLREASLT